MKGQSDILEEILVFALSFIVAINLVVFFKKTEYRSYLTTEEQILRLNGENLAVALTKSYLAKGNVSFRLDPDAGKDRYNVWYSGGLFAGNEKKQIEIPLFGLDKASEITANDITVPMYFIVAYDSGLTLERNRMVYLADLK